MRELVEGPGQAPRAGSLRVRAEAQETGEERTLEPRIVANRRRAARLLAAFAAVVFVVLAIVALLITPALVGVALLLALLAAWWAWRRCGDVALDLADAGPADEHEHARLFNVTSGLCAAMGVPSPTLHVVDDAARNAMICGRNADDASLVVTRGLLEGLNLVELEAVVAHQLYRVKSAEIVPETLMVTTIGLATVLADRADRWDWLSRFLGAASRFLEPLQLRLHPANLDLDLDLAAMQFTRYPPALASALEKMAGRSVLEMASSATAHLWIAPPMNTTARPAVVHLHAPLDERIAVLQEM